MKALEKKVYNRQRRHWRVRKKVVGTPERLRLSVFRSIKHISAQIIDDLEARTLCAVSTHHPEVKKEIKHGGDINAAKIVGKRLAEKSKIAGIQKVVFDRGSFPYHGRIKALAESARQGGLQF
jgi:large subunit ribosomal protein L18